MSEVYVFRPLPQGEKPNVWLRYAGGLWLPDDGEFDLAFVDLGFPWGLFVTLPSHEGIEWSWMDGVGARKAAGIEERGVNVNPWHYQVRDPALGWGEAIPGQAQERHPNGVARRAAMDKCADLHHCANGRGSRFELKDPWAQAGLLRTWSGEIVWPPYAPRCYLCSRDGFGHRLKVLEELRHRYEGEIAYDKEQIAKLEREAVDVRGSLEWAEGRLEALRQLGTTEPTEAVL